MAGVTFIDSSGIFVLIRALKPVRSGGRQLTLSGVNPGAYKVLDICGFTGVFDLPSPSAGSGDEQLATRSSGGPGGGVGRYCR